MAYGRFSLLLTKRRHSLYSLNPKSPFLLSHLFSTSSPNPNPKPSSLSARLSFVFDQIDAIEKERSQKHETVQRIRAWRESKNTQNDIPEPVSEPTTSSPHENQNPNPVESKSEVAKKEVELVHPWPEWIQLMERLVHQNYFDHKRKDEDKMVQDLGFDLPEVPDDAGFDATKDFKSVHAACLNFGKDRFDLLRSLSRQDIQLLVGFGCPTVDRKVVFSAKLLRKHAHLDEGDVCSSCSLRNNCDNAYLLTNKESEAQTMDVMRMLLTFGFDPVNGSVVNKSLLKQKSVKAVVRKLLHEVVKLSSVPIDPNLPPPVIRKPPPKVKQPPTPPKRRVGRDDVEMKKGDWLCPKCDFMNFAKNNACLQCDAKRPKRQLLPGEWECPECNFLNYRRNVVCFHCECKRPADEFLENKMQDKKHSSGPKMDKMGSRQEVSNAWNFDFDDNESDGADVAAFEYADARAMAEDLPSDNNARHGSYRGWENDFEKNSRMQGSHDGEYADPGSSGSTRIGFDDFDDEDDIDSYELETQTSNSRMEVSKNNFSESEDSLEWENSEDTNDKMHAHHKTSGRRVQTRSARKTTSFSGSKDDELDYDSDEQRSILSKFKSSDISAAGQKRTGRGPTKKLSFGSESDEDVAAGLYSDEDDDLNDSHSFRKNKGNRHDSGRRNFTKDRRSGSNGGYKANMFSDDFDESPRQSYRSDTGSRGSNHDRKRFEDFDGSSRESYGNGKRSQGNDHFGRSRHDSGRRNFAEDRKSGSNGGYKTNMFSDDFDESPRQSYRSNTGSRGSNRDRKRFEDFDGSSRQSYGNGKRSQGNDHFGSSRHSYENGKGSRGNDRVGSSRQSYGNGRGSRGNERNGSMRPSYGNGRGPGGNNRSRQRFDDMEHGRGRSNKFSMDENDVSEFKNSRRVIER